VKSRSSSDEYGRKIKRWGSDRGARYRLDGELRSDKNGMAGGRLAEMLESRLGWVGAYGSRTQQFVWLCWQQCQAVTIELILTRETFPHCSGRLGKGHRLESARNEKKGNVEFELGARKPGESRRDPMWGTGDEVESSDYLSAVVFWPVSSY
jgi:hypothetical protein